MKSIRKVLASIRRADETFNLINDKDKICVGVSGGKDSMCLLYTLNIYKLFSKKNFEIYPVMLNLGFDGFNPNSLIEYCKTLGLNLIIEDSTSIYKILKINQKNKAHLPCSICSRMKKAAINKKAKELGCNKVAFAHHADDAVETLFMNEIYGSRIATFEPKMYLSNADITFIRPLIFTRESEIKKLVQEESIYVMGSICPADKHTTREIIKNDLKDLYHKYPSAKDAFLTMLTNSDSFSIWTNKIEYQIDNSKLLIKPVNDALSGRIEEQLIIDIFSNELKFNKKEVSTFTNDEGMHFVIELNKAAIGVFGLQEENRIINVSFLGLLKTKRNKGHGESILKFIENMVKSRYNPCILRLKAPNYVNKYLLNNGYEKENAPTKIGSVSYDNYQKKL